MKTLICLLTVVTACLSFAETNRTMITLHLQCDSGPQCKEMKSTDRGPIRVESIPALSFTPENIAEAWVTKDQEGREQLSLTLTKEAADQFEKVTHDNINKIMALTIGDHVLMAPVIKQTISGGRLMIENGTDNKTSLLDEVPWLREKVSHVEAETKRKNDRDVILYAVITGVMILGTLVFTFKRRQNEMNPT